MRILVGVVLMVALVGGTRVASASDAVACGSSPGGTNIPNGAVFLSQGSGPVMATLAAVGEARSHSGISHGNGWYTHSTTYEPRIRDWDDSECSCGWITGDYCCQGPLKGFELQNGYPGASQITAGGLYNFYYNVKNGVAPNFLYYQRSLTAGAPDARGAAVANWLWSNSTYAWVTSRQDGGQGFFRVGFTGVTPYSQYSLYQYRDYENINNGGIPWNYGAVCSTQLAYAQQQAGKGVVNNTRSHHAVPGVPNSYTHDYVVAGLNALYNSVYNDCSDGNGFLESVGVFFTCSGETDICDDAARQVSNCFADGKSGVCYNDGNRAEQVKNNQWPGGPVDASGYSIAKSISPDNIGGWSGWAHSTPTASVWSSDGNQPVNFNTGGSVYSCFF